MYSLSQYAEIGGLMAYGPSIPDLFRWAVVYVDKILKGAKPAELPVVVAQGHAATACDLPSRLLAGQVVE